MPSQTGAVFGIYDAVDNWISLKYIRDDQYIRYVHEVAVLAFKRGQADRQLQAVGDIRRIQHNYLSRLDTFGRNQLVSFHGGEVDVSSHTLTTTIGDIVRGDRNLLSVDRHVSQRHAILLMS